MAEAPIVNQPENRIQVSNTKKPLFFYVNLAKVYAYCLCPAEVSRQLAFES